MSPYDRPPIIPSRTDMVVPATIASRMKRSAARVLRNSASFVLSSFCKSRPPALEANGEPLTDEIADKREKPKQLQQQHELVMDSIEEVTDVQDSVKEIATVRGVTHPLEKEVLGSDITQIEEVLKKSTWSRDQVDRLTELLLSRVRDDEDRTKEAETVVEAETKQIKLEPETPIHLARVFMEERAIKPSGVASPVFSPGFYPSAKVQPSPGRRLMEDRRVFSPLVRPWTQSPDVVSSPKRRFNVVDGFLSTSSMRRVRQKTSDTSSHEYSRSTSESNVGLGSPLLAESSKTALKILEALEKLSPSPMATSSDVSVKRSTTLIDNTSGVPTKRIHIDKDRQLNVLQKESPTPNGDDLEVPRRVFPHLNGKAIQGSIKDPDKFIVKATPVVLPALKEQCIDKKESSTRVYPSEQILETSGVGEDRSVTNGSKSEVANLASVKHETGIDFKTPASVLPERSKGFRMTAIFEDFETAINDMPVSPAIISDIPPTETPSSVSVVQPTEGASIMAKKAIIAPFVLGEPSKHVPALAPQSAYPGEANIATSLETSMIPASNVSPSRPTENGLPMLTESPVRGQVVEADSMLLDDSVQETVASAPIGVSSASILSFGGAATQRQSLDSFPAELPTTSSTSLAFTFSVQSGTTTPTLVTSEPLLSGSSPASSTASTFQFGSSGTTIKPFPFVGAQPNPFTTSASSAAPMGATFPFGSQPAFSFGAQAQSAATFGMSPAGGGASAASSTLAFGAQMNGQSMNLAGGFSIGVGGFSAGTSTAKRGRKFIKAKRRK